MLAAVVLMLEPCLRRILDFRPFQLHRCIVGLDLVDEWFALVSVLVTGLKVVVLMVNRPVVAALNEYRTRNSY